MRRGRHELRSVQTLKRGKTMTRFELDGDDATDKTIKLQLVRHKGVLHGEPDITLLANGHVIGAFYTNSDRLYIRKEVLAKLDITLMDT